MRKKTLVGALLLISVLLNISLFAAPANAGTAGFVLGYVKDNPGAVFKYIAKENIGIIKDLINKRGKERAVDFALENSESILNYATTHKIPDSLTKGNEAAIAVGVKYAAENKQNLNEYIKQNKENIKNAVAKNDFKDLAVDYGLKNSDAIINFAVKNKNEILSIPAVKDATGGANAEIALGIKYVAENGKTLSSYISKNKDKIKKAIDENNYKDLAIDYGLKNIDGILGFAARNRKEIAALKVVRDNTKGYEGEVALGLEYLAKNKNQVSAYLSENKGLLLKSVSSGEFEDLGIGYALSNVDGLANFAIENNAKIKQLPLFKKLIAQLASDGSSNTGNTGTTGDTGNTGGSGGNTGNTGNTGTGGTGSTGGNANSGEKLEDRIKAKLVDFMIANPKTGVKLIEAYKDVLTAGLVKGYETEVKYALAYVTEEQDAFCGYLKNNQFARNAIMKGNYKDLAIDYMKSQPMSVIKFVVRHRSELPGDVIDLAVKYAVKDATTAALVRAAINNKSIDVDGILGLINKNTGISTESVSTFGRTISDLFNKFAGFRAPADAAPGTASASDAGSTAPVQADPAALKAAKDRMTSAYRRFMSENAPTAGPVFEEYKSAVENYKMISGGKR